MKTKSTGDYLYCEGFIMISLVISISSFLLMISSMNMLSALYYSDMVNRREFRIQKKFNVAVCEQIKEILSQRKDVYKKSVIYKEIDCLVETTQNI